jgi:hypothetical protein
MEQISPEEAQARVRAVFGDIIEVKSPRYTPEEDTDSDADVVDLLTRVCYFYPQYDLESVEKLTDSQVTALLVQAEKQRAIEFYNYTLIAAAPHSKKGKLVEKLIKQYNKIADL